MTTYDLINQKIACAGSVPEPHKYPKANRSYSGCSQQPLDVYIPEDSLGFSLRQSPISFGETLLGRPPQNKQVKTISIPLDSFESKKNINIPFSSSSRKTVNRNYSHMYLQMASGLTIDSPIREISFTAQPTKKVSVITNATPDLIPKNIFVKTIEFKLPNKVPVSAEPVIAVPNFPEKLNTSVALDVQSNLNPSEPVTEPISLIQPIIPFSTSMSLSKTFSEKYSSKPLTQLKPPVVASSNTTMRFEPPPGLRQEPKTLPTAPTPTFSLTTLNPDKFQIR